MFSPQFAEYSSKEAFSPGRLKAPALLPERAESSGVSPSRGDEQDAAVEQFSTEGVITTLDAISGADTNSRSVALKLESEMAGKSLSGHETEALNAALDDWMRITHHVMDYQYVHDMNTYVHAVQTDERTRLTRQYNTIANDVMVKKHMYTMRERDALKLQSRVRILLHSMLFVSAFAFLYANRAFFGTAGWVMLGIMSFAFGVYIIMYLKMSMSRRYNDWDSLYFNDGDDIETETATDDLPGNQAKCEQVGSVPFGTVA